MNERRDPREAGRMVGGVTDLRHPSTGGRARTRTSMNLPTDQRKPVIEPSPDGTAPADDLTFRALRLRIRQQEILAELGVLALQGPSLGQLLDQTARLTAEGLEAEFCEVLEFLPSENRFLVRAGVGWDAGVVGSAKVD